MTFTAGFVPVRVWENSFFFEPRVQVESVAVKAEQPKTLYDTSPDGKIEVKLRSFGKLENRPTLIFEIINRNSNAAKYWSQAERSNFSYVKFNGKEKKVNLCGTGMREFELAAGESFTLEVLADSFLYEYLNKKGSIQIGYMFNLKGNFRSEFGYETFWSEPFVISDSLRDEIIKNAPEWVRAID